MTHSGCTDHQIAAITGYKILSMVQKYSKGANQKRLAKEAKTYENKNGAKRESEKLPSCGHFRGLHESL